MEKSSESFRFRLTKTKKVERERIIPLFYKNRQNAKNRGLTLSPEIRVAYALRFFATGSYQLAIIL